MRQLASAILPVVLLNLQRVFVGSSGFNRFCAFRLKAVLQTWCAVILTGSPVFAAESRAVDQKSPTPPFTYVWAKAFYIPPETTTEES